jgi:cytochrome P450 family 117 subfamily A
MLNPFARGGQREGLPIHPGAFPLVGHVPAIYYRLPEVLRRAQASLGPLYWVAAGFGWVLFCSGPEAVHVFHNRAFDSSHLEKLAPAIASGTMLARDGAPHRHLRGALAGPFLPRGLTASGVGATIAVALGEVAARWVGQGSARVLPDAQDAALDIIFRLIGVAPAELPTWRDKYRALVLANLGITARFPGSPATRSDAAKTWIDAHMRALIADARRAPATAGLLGALLAAQDDDGAALTDDEVVDNLRLIVLGGHESISATIAWMTVTLAHRPELWDTLVAEAGDAEAIPTTPAAAKAFPFAEALFRETVRLHPPFAFITRTTREDTTISGHRIAKGTLVGVDLWSASHDSATFPDPDSFLPSRWLGRSGSPSPLEISQFGAGPHFCLGYHLAWLEAVEFAVALAREGKRLGRRPRLRSKELPRAIYLPTEHPAASTRVDFVRG